MGKYATVSGVTGGDIIRRATVWGGEANTKASNLPAAREAPYGGSLGRSHSTRALGLRADVPVGMDSVRDSLISLLSNPAVPPSAASTATLFDDFEAGLGPQAESTPKDDALKQNPITSKKPAPRNPLPTPHTRRSSIVYIKSENDSPTNSDDVASPRSFTRAVRKLVPKNSILQRKQSQSPSDAKPASPPGSRGLRPLSLLQDRDTNRQVTIPATRPLVLGKKKQQQLATIRDDENVEPVTKNRNLKQLQLARSETSKQRGILRQSERLPDVVVRPPSTGETLGFVYGYAQ